MRKFLFVGAAGPPARLCRFPYSRSTRECKHNETYTTYGWPARAIRHAGLSDSTRPSNFIGCLRRLLGEVRVCEIGKTLTVRADGRATSIGVNPISVDYEQLAAAAAKSDVETSAATIRANLGDRRIVLGRLDYTKGIPERLDRLKRFCGRTRIFGIV